MATCKFHGTLKDHVPNSELPVEENCSVAEALSMIAAAHAPLKEVLYVDGTGEIRDFYRVLINGEMVEFLDEGMDTVLGADDFVQVFPPVSGG